MENEKMKIKEVVTVEGENSGFESVIDENYYRWTDTQLKDTLANPNWNWVEQDESGEDKLWTMTYYVISEDEDEKEVGKVSIWESDLFESEEDEDEEEYDE